MADTVSIPAAASGIAPVRQIPASIHVELTNLPISLSAAVDRVRSPSAGAIVSFLGTTRDSFDGRRVAFLDYEAARGLAEVSLRRMCAQAAARWPDLVAAAVVHRLGRVGVGEESIAVVVSSPHRKTAWQAAEWLLEEAKAHTEVWKLETFADDAFLSTGTTPSSSSQQQQQQQQQQQSDQIEGFAGAQAPSQYAGNAQWKQNEHFGRIPLSKLAEAKMDTT